MEPFMEPEFCYWLGLVQTDGCFRKHYREKHTKFVYIIEVASKDLESLTFFQKVSSNLLRRNAKIIKEINEFQSIYKIRIGVGRLLKMFSELNINFSDPPRPPEWIYNNLELFGAYLAGIIDGDGNIRVNRKKYHRLLIRITSGKPQNELRDIIMKKLNCGCNITRRERRAVLFGRNIIGTAYDMEFGVSHKNIYTIKRFVLPWIQLPRKRDRLASFIETRMGPAGF